jgi:hypothetical protein
MVAIGVSRANIRVRCHDSELVSHTIIYAYGAGYSNYKNIYKLYRPARGLLVDIRVRNFNDFRVRNFDDFRVFCSSAIMRSECRSGHDQAAGAFREQRPEIAFRQARADCGVELQQKK